MNVLVTGSNGFIGKNLISHLQEIDNVHIITYDIDDTFDKIKREITGVDFIFHLAGVNRPQSTQEFYEGNSDLTKKIVDLIKDKSIPILVTSSVQAEKDNDYGNSKKIAENYIIENLSNYYIFRLHNVFGKWCKPNYNSVVATFCYNISHGLDIQVDDPNKELELIYIDDIIEEFIKVLSGSNPDEKKGSYCYINPRYKVSLQYIVNRLENFKNSMSSIYVPNTGNDFIKKLYATYISYLELNKMAVNITKNVDSRGAFAELIKTHECGQFSISYSKPGVIRGNHYHHTKMERFIVIKGKAKISFSSVISNDKYSFIVDENDMKAVTIPVGYTHNIENIGDEEMILALWCNELFDKDKPDTYNKDIEKLNEKTKSNGRS